MMKEEFEKRIGHEICYEDWETVETVYMNHPSIDNVQGKDQLAHLYRNYGMIIIEDMRLRAEKVENVKIRQQNLRNKKHQIDQEIQGLNQEIMELSTPNN